MLLYFKMKRGFEIINVRLHIILNISEMLILKRVNVYIYILLDEHELYYYEAQLLSECSYIKKHITIIKQV